MSPRAKTEGKAKPAQSRKTKDTKARNTTRGNGAGVAPIAGEASGKPGRKRQTSSKRSSA